jgi:hypothetical protein
MAIKAEQVIPLNLLSSWQEFRRGNPQAGFEILDTMKKKAEHDSHSLQRIQFLRTLGELELALGR